MKTASLHSRMSKPTALKQCAMLQHQQVSVCEMQLCFVHETRKRAAEEAAFCAGHLSLLMTCPSKTRPSCSATCTTGVLALVPAMPPSRSADASATMCAFVRMVPSGSKITPLPLDAPCAGTHPLTDESFAKAWYLYTLAWVDAAGTR